jgi:hypothetical protein
VLFVGHEGESANRSPENSDSGEPTARSLAAVEFLAGREDPEAQTA